MRGRIDGKQGIDLLHDGRSDRIARIQLRHIRETTSAMSPASGMDQSRPAHFLVGHISIRLQNPAVFPKELLRPFATSSQTKVEHHRSPRTTVLPKVGLMIVSPPIVHLHVHRGFIGLPVTSRQHTIFHRPPPQPSLVARLSSSPLSCFSVTLCRYRGRWLPYLLTSVWITTPSLTSPFSMIRFAA